VKICKIASNGEAVNGADSDAGLLCLNWDLADNANQLDKPGG